MQPVAVRKWVAAWRAWQGSVNLIWCDRRWRALGLQSLPERLVLEDPPSVAAVIEEEERWNRAWSRHCRIVSGRPALNPRLARYFDALADYSDPDMARLEALLAWIESNPRSHLYPRQIPLAGMDTKWLEARMPMIADLVAAWQADKRTSSKTCKRASASESVPVPPFSWDLAMASAVCPNTMGGCGGVHLLG